MTTPQVLMSECRAAGVLVCIAGDNLQLKGPSDAVRAISNRIRPFKAMMIGYLASHGADDLVREFMEIDGMTLEEARATAAISVQPRPAAEWLALIADLDEVIARYCDAVGAAAEARAAMLAARYVQPLASIPESLAWFRSAHAAIERNRQAPASQSALDSPAGNYEGRASAKAAREKLHKPILKG